MFLKRIVLHGFKSFADRTEFEFGPGLTSIVGPNGCGKSNVLDALRWVLGEQSARTLRGSKMMDVIFAGSRTRKPATFADVQLTFDNSSGILGSDQAEVVVGRTLYASGESEYRLNGNVSRLRDVRELFLDTGVGVDAYSVIEQGRVDAMLQASPLERREIFEEAAGISRYKLRRTEAQRKLERTQNNLLRLNDVLDELEKRLRSVRLAAGKARSFQEYDRRLRELRSSASLAEYDELERLRRGQRAAVDGLADVLGARRVELASRDAACSALAHELQGLDEAIHACETRLAALRTEGSTLAERVEQGRRRLADLAETRRQTGEQSLAAAQRTAQTLRWIEEAERTLAELRAAEESHARAAAELHARRADGDRARDEAASRLDLARRAAFEAARHASVRSSELTGLDEQRARLEASAAAARSRAAQVAAERCELLRRREELGRLEQELSESAEALAVRVSDAEGRLHELAAQKEDALGALAAQKEERRALASQIELLEDMERRLEGVDLGTRWVLELDGEQRRTSGVLGLVADLLRIDDARVAALLPVLASFESHVVVEDTYAFLAALRRAGAAPGPIRVLALDRLPARTPPQRYHDAPGFVACALDWVTCDERVRPLAEELLGRVVVVDALERALALADGAPDGYVFATLDGTLIESGGRLLLAADRAPLGLISRKAELRALRERRDDVETALERAGRAAAETARAEADAVLLRESLMQEAALGQRRHADARAEATRLDDGLRRCEREAALLGGEVEQLERARGSLLERIAAAQLERDVSEEDLRTHERSIHALEAALREAEAALAVLAQQEADARVDAARAVERRAAAEHALADLRSQAAAEERSCSEASAASREAGARIERLEQEIAAAEARGVELARQTEAAETEGVRLRTARQGVRRRLEAAGAAVRELHGMIGEVDAALRGCEVALRETEVRQESLVARVRDELELDLVELHRGYRAEAHDAAALREEAESLRQKIARLGHVNLDAIAELEELAPRFEHLGAQRDDLLASVSQLERLIAELDAESRRRFQESFEQIRLHFQEVFRKVFGGGRADVLLEDPENPLECGIEVIARPPGKEPQSISLLSGGEKTMTAIALLLAVFKSKPSPFAILDEVDAALDESNVDRFNAVLDEFLENSQFIVITHNKRTMQHAEALYGVTMEEAGVSKRVAVRLREQVSV